MREIKFRGMDANGIMRYGRLSQDKPQSTLYYEEYSQRICWDDSNIPVKNSTLGQFTGLKDNNGKEIYEGDIIEWKISGYSMSSSWISPNIGCMAEDERQLIIIKDITNLPSFKAYTMIGSIERESTIEVIGNTFDNPKLLKEAK